MVENCPKKDEYFIKLDDNSKKITVRELQLEILEIMDEIHRVCIKNNIKYALIAGSALGVYNYQGFIPWDDDIDICVERKDYLRFIEVLKKDLDHKFYFQCFETDKKYNVLIPSMKIRKRGTYIEEVNTLLKNRCKSGDGIFVDVVIYDSVPNNKYIDQLWRFPIRILMPIMVLFDNIRINPILLKKLVLKISELYAKKNKNSKYASQTLAIPWEKFMKEPVFLKEDIFPFKLYEFEGRKFYSYNNLKPILLKWYGPNCLKKWNGKEWIETLPIEKRNAKHTKYLNLKGETKE